MYYSPSFFGKDNQPYLVSCMGQNCPLCSPIYSQQLAQFVTLIHWFQWVEEDLWRSGVAQFGLCFFLSVYSTRSVLFARSPSPPCVIFFLNIIVTIYKIALYTRNGEGAWE